MNKMFFLFLTIGLLSACSSSKSSNDSDETFKSQNTDYTEDQDSLSLELPDYDEDGAPSGSGDSHAFEIFVKEGTPISLSKKLWKATFNSDWIDNCAISKKAGSQSCIVKNTNNEKAVVVAKVNAKAVARKIFIDCKGQKYVKHWIEEMDRAEFKRQGSSMTFVSKKLGTRAKIVFVKKLNAATLILEAL